jgi:hypothetical protein
VAPRVPPPAIANLGRPPTCRASACAARSSPGPEPPPRAPSTAGVDAPRRPSPP